MSILKWRCLCDCKTSLKILAQPRKKKEGFSKVRLFLQAVLDSCQLSSQNCCFPHFCNWGGQRATAQKRTGTSWAPSARPTAVVRMSWQVHSLSSGKNAVWPLFAPSSSVPFLSQIFQCYEWQPLVVQVPFCMKAWKFPLPAWENWLFILPLLSLILPYVMSTIKPVGAGARSLGSLQWIGVLCYWKMSGN